MTFHSASAYCGGLWLAALHGMGEMAKALELPADLKVYSEMRDQGIKSFHSKLWNGE